MNQVDHRKFSPSDDGDERVGEKESTYVPSSVKRQAKAQKKANKITKSDVKDSPSGKMKNSKAKTAKKNDIKSSKQLISNTDSSDDETDVTVGNN